jgi:hypothetical protein
MNDGDPFDDPIWQRAAEMADALPRPAKGYVAVPLAWLNRIRSVVRTSEQFLVAMLLYRRCLTQRGRTVSFPNVELEAMGISRQTKYRTLAWLIEAGAVSIENESERGRALRVTLHWFP